MLFSVQLKNHLSFQAGTFQYKEIKGDLFSCPPTSSLAHCISEDVRMGKGIAVLFKNKFGGVQDLLRQGNHRLYMYISD